MRINASLTRDIYFQIGAMALLCALYIAVRLWGLTDVCLWFDEIFSVHAAEHSWDTILSFIAADLIHPPLFYILLKLWTTTGGEGIYWLRLLPVILSVLAVFPFLALCRELDLSFRIRLLALFLFAVNGSLIKYAQEVRMYSLLLCLSLFSIWLFTRCMNRKGGVIPLVIVSILLVYTHYFGWLVIGAEAAAVALLHRQRWRQMAAIVAVTVTAFVPWVWMIIEASASGSGLGQNIGWMSRPGLRQIGTFLLNLVEPAYHQMSSAEPVSYFLVSIPIALCIAAAGVIYIAGNRQDRSHGRPVYLLALVTGVPTVAALAASWLLPYSIWGTRHLIIVFAPWAILASVILVSVQQVWLRRSLIALAIGASGFGFLARPERNAQEYSWCRWEQHSASIERDASIYAAEDIIAYHIWFARREMTPAVYKVTGLDGIREDAAYFLPRRFTGVTTKDVAAIDEDQVWFAYRGSTIDPAKPPLQQFAAKGYRIEKYDVQSTNSDGTIMLLLEK
ncbi:MAG TPA: hypothetical protein VNA17_07800 [Pyrinomonadaceae bacterium]|nr:hypothetical protein [Pyrinomonadaceae bacterium]